MLSFSALNDRDSRQDFSPCASLCWTNSSITSPGCVLQCSLSTDIIIPQGCPAQRFWGGYLVWAPASPHQLKAVPGIAASWFSAQNILTHCLVHSKLFLLLLPYAGGRMLGRREPTLLSHRAQSEGMLLTHPHAFHVRFAAGEPSW